MKLFRTIFHADARKDPDSLLRLFVAVALVSIILITSLAGYAFYRVLQKNLVDSAEEDAIKVSTALSEDERARFTVAKSDGTFAVEVLPENFFILDRDLRTFLSPFDIVKIKIYSSDCRIVYSTEAKLIGEVDRDNRRLARALTGAFDSKLERKEEVKDLADELKFNVDVVETYIPIRARGKVIGSFEVYIDVTKYRQQTVNAAFLSLAALCGTLMVVFGISFVLIRRGTNELKETQEVLRKQTLIDGLTGTFNKMQIEMIGRREFARALRRREKGLTDAEVGFIMIDIDRFKQVNDRYGHLAGDHLLQLFAERVSASLRSYDSLGRFGGEEFLVVLPGSDREQTLSVAHKIWSLIREEPFLVDGEPLRITASAGVANVQHNDDDLLQVLKRADQNLYQAKSGGRDRVV
ncbi:GGDEF domain-containing protein [Geomonas sp. Red69]|uniref:diguanylate cyclase n=1 Tax=Geomonas diazotrophica TaxID=2843197 RepID=A0ABX8JJ83_9BACT|nr:MULTISPECIES: GGDEF domain-containing protein [Geomonas]MBU5635251.1 GGDEF domain-containing protein [Geomonas diazotrophica]QWV97694.1 GGDEF domain-containing protein [Geomonas nitrogeniifigens]QXE86831.1 GGDEF domain-containing protein [Geomonas nitrogeniifigens]